MKTFPSSDPEAMTRSLKGFLAAWSAWASMREAVLAHQSVSSTGAVWPLNNGICSGKRPFSLSGITANAPPPLASQLTARYSGLT